MTEETTGQQVAVATQAAPPTTANFLNVIARAAADPNTDVAKMHGLLDVQERMMNKQAELDFNVAFGKLQRELSQIRIGKNGSIKVDGRERSKYATYDDIDAAIRPLMNKHGFTLRFSSMPEGGKLVVEGTLSHENGHSIKTVTPMAIDANPKVMNSQQAIGSASSYAQRYIVKMLLNLVFEGEDDDGKSAGVKPISDDQAVILKDLIRETETDVVKFLAVMTGMKSVDEIAARDFNRVHMALLAKKNAAAKAVAS